MIEPTQLYISKNVGRIGSSTPNEKEYSIYSYGAKYTSYILIAGAKFTKEKYVLQKIATNYSTKQLKNV